MASFAYYPPVTTGGIDPTKLQHPYYVQVAPDGHHLVPGMLQQDTRPSIGSWLQVGNITRDLPARYFVQYTDFDTLVPGSLIPAQKLPAGKWKELKKNLPPIHRFTYTQIAFRAFVVTSLGGGEWVFVDSMDQFNYYVLITSNPSVLDTVFPGFDWEDNTLTFKLFYFYGSFAEFKGDPSKLTSFTDTDSIIRLFTSGGTDLHTDTITQFDNSESVFFKINRDAPIGNYMIVLGHLDDDGNIDLYIALEDLFEKQV